MFKIYHNKTDKIRSYKYSCKNNNYVNINRNIFSISGNHKITYVLHFMYEQIKKQYNLIELKLCWLRLLHHR